MSKKQENLNIKSSMSVLSAEKTWELKTTADD